MCCPDCSSCLSLVPIQGYPLCSWYTTAGCYNTHCFMHGLVHNYGIMARSRKRKKIPYKSPCFISAVWTTQHNDLNLGQRKKLIFFVSSRYVALVSQALHMITNFHFLQSCSKRGGIGWRVIRKRLFSPFWNIIPKTVVIHPKFSTDIRKIEMRSLLQERIFGLPIILFCENL